MNIRRSARKYTEILKISHNELLINSSNYVARLLIHALRICIFGIVYTFVFDSSGKDAVNGITAIQAVWALAFVQLIYQSSRNTFKQIKEEILSGQIETKLNKPYSYITFNFLEALGHAPMMFLGFTGVTIVVLLTFFGSPGFTTVQLLGILPLYILGLVLHILIQQLTALSAFWIENPDPVFWITSKLAWIVNGTFVPLALLPLIFRQIATLFPLSAPFFLGRIFEINGIGDLMIFLLIQIFWIMVFVALIQIVYSRGVRKVSINGG